MNKCVNTCLLLHHFHCSFVHSKYWTGESIGKAPKANCTQLLLDVVVTISTDFTKPSSFTTLFGDTWFVLSTSSSSSTSFNHHFYPFPSCLLLILTLSCTTDWLTDCSYCTAKESAETWTCGKQLAHDRTQVSLTGANWQHHILCWLNFSPWTLFPCIDNLHKDRKKQKTHWYTLLIHRNSKGNTFINVKFI